MQKKINFNAGPAELPPEVLHETARAVREYKDTGLSILELPHRSKEFKEIIEESKELVRELCGLTNDHEVLWLQGGARLQFAMLPMNFLPAGGAAGYIDSGHWAHEAMEYGKYYGTAQVLASSEKDKYNQLPVWPSKIPEQLAYVHFTTNNTIYGTQWQDVPTINVPLVADMSSDILSAAHDYSRYAMFYAAVQKNLGTPGLALAVIRKDFLKQAADNVPPMLSYKAQVKENSILNTANVSGVYVSLLMLRWIKARGIAAIEKENTQKAQILYKAIDESKYFNAYVQDKEHRSKMNVCFTADTKENEAAFLDLCKTNNIIGISGYRAVGGFRASIYNAVPVENVAKLAALIQEFEAK